MLGERFLAHEGGGAALCSRRYGERRPSRLKKAGGRGGSPRHPRQHQGGVFPRRLRDGVFLRPHPSSRDGERARERVPRGGRCRAVGPCRQHQAFAPLRAQLRIFLRRSFSCGRACLRLRAGRAGRGSGGERQALCRQQSGDAQDVRLLRDERARAAGDLFPRV